MGTFFVDSDIRFFLQVLFEFIKKNTQSVPSHLTTFFVEVELDVP